ncbi:MAG: HPF/RaiA family ribosome-associated protein [Rhodomicrobium sp.]|nr:HPF/RaiA family ribosome-associated protein [Rhodomicrobium sp.]
MLTPIQITFEGVRHSDVIEGYIRHEMENLSDIDAHITSSNIVVSEPRAKHFSGDPYRLRVRLTVEGGPDVNVNHDPGAGRRHDAMQIAVRDTFRIVRRRLEDAIRRQQSAQLSRA